MPHIRIKNEYFRTPEYLRFSKSKESAVLQFLIANIVRQGEPGKHPAGAVKMRERYFDKGKLCAAYSLGDIARFFGWGSDEKPNKSYVSKLITKLENMGLLVKLTEATPLGRKNIYQLGYHTGTYGSEEYKEHLYFDQIFETAARKQRQKMAEAKQKKADAEQKQREKRIQQRAEERLKRFKPDVDTRPKAKYDRYGEILNDISTPEGERAEEQWVIDNLLGGKVPSLVEETEQARRDNPENHRQMGVR